MRLRDGLPSLRRLRAFEVLKRRLLAGSERFGFRLIEVSIQSNHLHLIAEAANARSLTRGMQGLAVRIARGVNKLWDRSGKVFADRYHARILRTPREVRSALAYVFGNARKHGVRVPNDQPDIFSTGPWFSGWKNFIPLPLSSAFAWPLARARTWLLCKGWRARGRLDVNATPG